MMFAPRRLATVKVTERHTDIGYAFVLEISDDYFPHADLVTFFAALNIHAESFFLQAFPAPEAGPPGPALCVGVHAGVGSWLDRRRIQAAVLSGQCLDPRISPINKPSNAKVAAWVKHRNQHHAKADWRFTTETARIKLKPGPPPALLLGSRKLSRMKVEACRASAEMVGVRLTIPPAARTLPSTMKRLRTSQVCCHLLTTNVSGPAPIRHVPVICQAGVR